MYLLRIWAYIEVSDNLDFKGNKESLPFKKPRFDTFIRNLDSEELENLCE